MQPTADYTVIDTRLPDFAFYSYTRAALVQGGSKFVLTILVGNFGTVASTFQRTVAVFMSADYTPPATHCTNRTGTSWVTVPVKATLAVAATYPVTFKGLVVPSGAVGTAYAHIYVDSKCEVEELSPDEVYTVLVAVAG